MANSGRRAINYTPRMTDMQAIDAMPPRLALAVKLAVNDWCAYSIYRQYKKLCKDKWPNIAENEIISQLKFWDKSFINKGWVPARGKRKALPSPCVMLGIEPLYDRDFPQ